MGKLKLFLAICLLLLLSQSAWATTYYVKTGGNDALTGLDDANAWETIAKVEAIVTSGDTVYFRSQDTWAGAVFPLLTTDAGVVYNGSTYGAGTRATIQAGDDNASFVSLKGVVQIDVGGVTISGFNIDMNNKRTGGIYSGLYNSSPIDSITINNCLIHDNRLLDRIYFTIGINEPTAGQTLTGQTSSSTGVVHSVVVTEGSWAGDDAVGYILYYDFSAPGYYFTCGEVLKVGETTIATVKATGCAAGEDWAYGIQITNKTSGGFASNVTITNNSIYNCDHEGVALYAAWSNETASVDTVLVQSNTLYANFVGLQIANNVDNVTAELNTIYSNTGMGIWIRTSPEGSAGSPENAIIRRNKIYSNLKGFDTQLGIVKTMSASIYGNIFYDNTSIDLSIANGEYDPSSSFNIYNNTIYNATSATTYGVFSIAPYSNASTPPTINFNNNIIYSTVRPFYDHWGYATHSDNLIYRTSAEGDSHVYDNGSSYTRAQVTTWDATAENTTPLMVSPTTDFHLQGASPAKAAGLNLGTGYTDFAGVSLPTPYGWPIGAYGYNSFGGGTGSFSGSIQ